MSGIEIFQEEFPSIESYWRSIILFGRNTASYKFALSKSLLKFAKQERNEINIDELALEYATYMCEHLKNAEKQASGKEGVFINACKQYNQQLISEEELIKITIKNGFNYVFDAFHIVNNKKLSLTFFEITKPSKLILKDELFKLKEKKLLDSLNNETEARWNLVETAWELGITKSLIDIQYDDNQKLLFTHDYLRRKNITSARSALNGYQKGKCFYCFRDINTSKLVTDTCDVDHFFPHILKPFLPGVNLDGVWNLVLACPACNRGENGKFAKVPSLKYLYRLNKRNEFLISSHHPLRETLIAQTGDTFEHRASFLKEIDKIAINHLIHRWEVESVDKEEY